LQSVVTVTLINADCNFVQSLLVPQCKVNCYMAQLQL